tara:strand:+ start:9017 stop:10321 length:1305 start_codon:yes stop_codon:yes gene_type:complete
MKQLIIILMCFSINANATDLMSLHDRAMQHNIDLLHKKFDLDIANETLKQTRSSIFPEVNFTATASETMIERYKSLGTYNPSNYDRDTYNLSIKQPLFYLYVFDEIKKSNDIVKQNEIRKNDSNSLLLLDTVRHYFNLIKFNNLVELNEAKKDFHNSKYIASEKLVNNNSISVQEYEKYKNEYSKSLVDVAISKNQLSEIKNDVYLFSGKELNDINNIKLTKINHKIFLEDELIQSAYNRNNSIKIARQNINISRNEIASQKSRHYPTVDIIAEYDYIDLTQGGSQFGATTREDSTISLVLNFPIYNGGYQSSKTNEARMSYQKARLDLDNTKRILRKDIKNTLNNYNTYRSSFELSLQVLDTNMKKYQNAKIGNEQGIYTDTQLLETKISYLESLFDAKNTMMDYLYTEITLDYLHNDLDITMLRKINSYLIW